jgi:predicted AAA+ superfamily ATPase
MTQLNEDPVARLLPLLTRIADAAERLRPPPPPAADPAAGQGFVWMGDRLRAVPLRARNLALLQGVDHQKAALLANSERLARGFPAHDVLLWGARGMGKSALVKGVVAALGSRGHDLALVQVARDDLGSLPGLFQHLAGVPRAFILFADDLSFEADERQYKVLRSVLEGGVEARPDNVRLYVTSNRRHLLARDIAENEAASAINPRDVIDDRMALADRFGLSLGFHNCDQPTYLAIVSGYASAYGLALDEHDALAWAVSRGARSGRVAWQYIQELAGRAGVRLP